jgi:hypothetical protein
MTNTELQAAIDSAAQYSRADYNTREVSTEMLKHLAALLEVQRARAARLESKEG